MVNNSSAITNGISTVDKFFSGLFTQIVVSLLIVFTGFIIGKILGRLIYKLLHEFKVDAALKKTAGVKISIEHILEAFISYFIYFVSIIMALNNLGLTTFI